MDSNEAVPELLEPQRGAFVPLSPQQRDHLPKGAHTRIPASRTRDEAPDHVDKMPRIWPAIDHAPRQRLGRIHRDVLPLLARAREVYPVGSETCFKMVPV